MNDKFKSVFNKVRERNPSLAKASDSEVADLVYKHYYSDMDRGEYYRKLGFDTSLGTQTGQRTENFGAWLVNAIGDATKSVTPDSKPDVYVDIAKDRSKLNEDEWREYLTKGPQGVSPATKKKISSGSRGIPLYGDLKLVGKDYDKRKELEKENPGFKVNETRDDRYKSTRAYLDKKYENFKSPVTWEDVKKDPLANAPSFIFREGVSTLPTMGLAARLPALFAAGESGRLAAERAENDDRVSPTGEDFLKTAPSALANTYLERLGIKGISNPTAKTALGRITKAGGQEALTEGLQEGFENFTTTAGTKRGFNIENMLDSAAAGALVGGPMGASLRGVGEIANRKELKDIDLPKVNSDVAEMGSVLLADRITDLMGRHRGKDTYDTRDVNPTSSTGAKAILERAHTEIAEDMKSQVNALAPYINYRRTDTEAERAAKTAVKVILRDARNRLKNNVTQEDIDFLIEYLGDTQEGQNLIRLVQESIALSTMSRGSLSYGMRKLGIAANPINRSERYGGRQLNTLGSALAVGGIFDPTFLTHIGQGTAIASGAIRSKIGTGGSRLEQFRRKYAGRELPQYMDPDVPSILENNRAALESNEASQEAARARGLELQRQALNDNIVPTGGFIKYVHDLTGLDPHSMNEGLKILMSQGVISQEEGVRFMTDPNSLMMGNVGNRIVDRLNDLADQGRLRRSAQPNPQAAQMTLMTMADPYVLQAQANQQRIGQAIQAVQQSSTFSDPEKQVLGEAIAEIGKTNNQEDAMDIAMRAAAGLSNPDSAMTFLLPLVSQIRHRTRRDAEAASAPGELIEDDTFADRYFEEDEADIETGEAYDIVDDEPGFLPMVEPGAGPAVFPVPQRLQPKVGLPAKPGGTYITIPERKDITGNTYSMATVEISLDDGATKPLMRIREKPRGAPTKEMGRKVKTNLFKQKAGWKWVGDSANFPYNTIVSVESGSNHIYTMGVDFETPVTMQTYPNSPSEPRLRPTSNGVLEALDQVGEIEIRGKRHPVYRRVKVLDKRLHGDKETHVKAFVDKVDKHKRRASGEYIGGPPGMDKPQKLSALRRELRRKAKEGIEGRFWYERSSRAILESVGWDFNEAKKIAGLVAVFSQSTPVRDNLQYAIQYYQMWKARGGNAALSGRFPTAQSERANRIMQGDYSWEGLKTNNFWINLNRFIDPKAVQGVTNDIWIMRAFGYDTEVPTQAQYRFVYNELMRMTDELNADLAPHDVPWEPQQVQAAIWVSIKNETEGKDMGRYDYADAMAEISSQVSWETVPGKSTDVLPGIHDLPAMAKADYHRRFSEAILDYDGVDMIAKALGIPSPGMFEAPGYFGGESNPSTQTEILAPRQYKGAPYGEVQEEAVDLNNAYAVAISILASQDAMAWSRVFPRGPLKAKGTAKVDIGRVLTADEMVQLADAVTAQWPDAAFVSDRTGVRIMNIGDQDQNRKFQKAVDEGIKSLEDFPTPEIRLYSHYSNYLENDWKDNPNGEGYLQGALGGRPDLQAAVRGIVSQLQPRIKEVQRKFAADYGLDKAGINPGETGVLSDLSEETGVLSNLSPEREAYIRELEKTDPEMAQALREQAERDAAKEQAPADLYPVSEDAPFKLYGQGRTMPMAELSGIPKVPSLINPLAPEQASQAAMAMEGLGLGSESPVEGPDTYMLQQQELNDDPGALYYDTINEVIEQDKNPEVIKRVDARLRQLGVPDDLIELVDPEGRELVAMFVIGDNNTKLPALTRDLPDAPPIGDFYETSKGGATKRATMLAHILADFLEVVPGMARNKNARGAVGYNPDAPSGSGPRMPGRDSRTPEQVVYMMDDELSQADYEDTVRHETGHLVEIRTGVVRALQALLYQARDKKNLDLANRALQIAGEMQQASREMRQRLWDSMADSNPDDPRSKTPNYQFWLERRNYLNNFRELTADAIKYYMENPGQFKQRYPTAARFIRDVVNPGYMRHVIQFMGVAGLTLASAMMMSLAGMGDEEDRGPLTMT